MKNTFIGFLLGILAAVFLLSNRKFVPTPEKKHSSRTPEEISPLYAKHQQEEGHYKHEGEYVVEVKKILEELIQPQMTEIELAKVRAAITDMVDYATTLPSIVAVNKSIQRDRNADRWIDELEDDADEHQ